MQPLNEPMETADPAQPGEYLIEYAFGTVRASMLSEMKAEDLLAIDIWEPLVTDCRGVRVGMTLDAALEDLTIPPSAQAPLVVLETQETGTGWSWAYIDEKGVYGVEYITFAGEGAQMKEYTLTYVIDGNRTISAIQIRVSDSTQMQADEGMRTAMEMASHQTESVLVRANALQALQADELRIMDAVEIGASVAQFVAVLGEPVEVQVLPGAQGRLLLYEGAALTIHFDVYTGEELVTSVSVSGSGVYGPRRLAVGQSLPDIISLFRCDADLGDQGGDLYSEAHVGTGILRKEADRKILQYTCVMDSGETGVLEIGFEDDIAVYWRMAVEDEDGQDDG